jgi:hypothetical protein
LKKIPWAAYLTASARLASSKMMLAPLPPSSRVTFLRLDLAASSRPCGRRRSTSEGDLVNLVRRREGVADSLSVAVDDVDDTVGEASLLDELGHVLSSEGVSSEGLMTMVQPTARAGASFQANMRRGKFQGMIWPATPTGSWWV